MFKLKLFIIKPCPPSQLVCAHLVPLVVPLLPDLAALGLPGVDHPLALEPAAGVVPLVLLVWGRRSEFRLEQMRP